VKLWIGAIAILALLPVGAQDFFVTPSDSIQQALDEAQPGDTIHLEDGIFSESFETIRDGTKDRPITIKGSPDAIIKGDGSGRMIQVFHDYIHFKGFTVDGLRGDPDYMYAYTDKLVYVQGKGKRDGVEGFKMLDMAIKNSGGEAVRLRYFVKDAEIAYCTFQNIGMHDFKFNDGGKNGEAIYLGTSSNQWADGKNPTADPDESTGNWIHHNYFDTQGNECVDIKEGAYNNIVEYNVCTGQKDPDSGGLDSRGDANIFRYNEVYGCEGAGVRIGGHDIDGHLYGQGNYVYGNNIHDNGYGAIKLMVESQADICDNTLSGNGANYGSYACTAATQCGAQLPGGDAPTTDTVPSKPDQKPAEEPAMPAQVGSIAVLSSSNDGNVCPNTLDGDMGTRWSAEGDGEYIQYDLGSVQAVSDVQIAFHRGDSRVQKFDILVSDDGSQWEKAFSGQSSSESLGLENFAVDADARYVRIVGHCNSENDWNSLTEVKFNTQAGVQEPVAQESHVQAVEMHGISVMSSSNDGNVCPNTLDSDLGTRWSAEGDGEYIQYDLGSSKAVQNVEIAFHKGDSRVQKFEIMVSDDGGDWQAAYSGQSSGQSLELQKFQLNADARFVRIVGHGNTENDWNSLTEVKFNTQAGVQEPVAQESHVKAVDMHGISVMSSSNDGNVCPNTLDGDISTRWSAEGDGEYIQYDLGSVQQVSSLGIAFHKGDSRVQKFDILVSDDGSQWEKVYSGQSSGESQELEKFPVDIIARYVRIVGHCNTENDWNSITETVFY